MIFIDTKYLGLLSPQLDLFKKTNTNVWNFRCPFCGDSKSDKTKARGYIYARNGMLKYKCHNCDVPLGKGNSFHVFLRELDRALYKDYLFEKMRAQIDENKGLDSPSDDVPELLLTSSKKLSDLLTTDPAGPEFCATLKAGMVDEGIPECPTLDTLPEDHKAVKYILDRGLPRDQLCHIGYVPGYKAYINTFLPERYKAVDDFEAIIFHLRTPGGLLTGIQGRNIGDTCPKIRYMTTTISQKLADDFGRLYGADRINIQYPVIVVEGPIDSLFLPNSIAVCGSDMGRVRYENAIYIPDNEPRNAQIVKKIGKMIKNNKRVTLLPEEYQGDDINDLFDRGLVLADIKELIKKHTFSGVRGMIEFENWRKS